MNRLFKLSVLASAISASLVVGDVTAAVLEEIIVTAQRRTESAQDVPISVTAADAEKLQELRLSNAEDISLLSPSISFKTSNSASSSSNIQIRGIGTTGVSRTFEGAVGVFIDGVYRTRSGQALTTFLDVDSLQVLRGPQGTLFGKNTSAGALLLNSTAPSFDEMDGYAEASAGNFGAYNVKGVVNLPLSDTAALRLAINHSEKDGYLDHTRGGTENDFEADSFKASLALQPRDDLYIKVIADYSKQDDGVGYGTANAVEGPTQPLIDGLP